MILPLESIKPGMITADYVYVFNMYQPLINPNTLLTAELIDRLQSYGVKDVSVDFDKEYMIREKLLPDVEPIIDEELKSKAENGIRRLFQSVSAKVPDESYSTAHQAVKELDTIVDQLVDTLETNPNELVRISDLKSYDEYTYHHSLSVAVLSIAIGQNLGYSQEKLKILGRSAIMHDIGKMFVPIEIINKPSKLNDSEFTIVKEHPKNGYNYLVAGEIGDEYIWQGVLHHHEKIDGTGYPDGLKGDDLSFISNVIAVADVYDAVTSYRSYRSPMSPANAVELIMSDVGAAFEYDVVKAFVNKLELYPINTCVELSNNRYGIVVNNTNSMRPSVRMLDNDEIIDLIDRKNLTIAITRVIDGLAPPVGQL